MKEKKSKDKIYGNKIREVLIEKNMSHIELSDLSGVIPSHLSKIINGQRRCVSLPIAIKIARALEKPVEELFIYQAQTEESENV
jgi:transcriptional regulator with XRE-family HTH domain